MLIGLLPPRQEFRFRRVRFIDNSIVLWELVLSRLLQSSRPATRLCSASLGVATLIYAAEAMGHASGPIIGFGPSGIA